MAFFIYEIKNILNGKKYIGWTSDFTQRMYEHRNNAYNPQHQAYNFALSRAIRKYGWHNFSADILQEVELDSEAKLLEIKFIGESNTHSRNGHGYNMTYGGDGTYGLKHTKKQRKANSLRNLGKKLSDSHKKHITEGLYSSGFVKKVSKKWVVVTPEGTEIVIDNLRRFCANNGLDQGNMAGVARGEHKHCKGWKCRGPIENGEEVLPSSQVP
jgi:group I intron endonuclease